MCIWWWFSDRRFLCVCLNQGGKSREKVVKVLVPMTTDEVLEKLKKEASSWPETRVGNGTMRLGKWTDIPSVNLILLRIWVKIPLHPYPPYWYSCCWSFCVGLVRKTCLYWGSVTASVTTDFFPLWRVSCW